jgi:hypothetical protein
MPRSRSAGAFENRDAGRRVRPAWGFLPAPERVPWRVDLGLRQARHRRLQQICGSRGLNRRRQGNAHCVHRLMPLMAHRFRDDDASARLLLQVLLAELGLPSDLDELDRLVLAKPAVLQEIRARALSYIAQSSTVTRTSGARINRETHVPTPIKRVF